MEKTILQVFKILGILMLSMLLWGFFYGASGRTFMWGAIEPAMINHWVQVTMNDGRDVSEVYREVFNEAIEYPGR
jgi:hypothetical protein